MMASESNAELRNLTLETFGDSPDAWFVCESFRDQHDVAKYYDRRNRGTRGNHDSSHSAESILHFAGDVDNQRLRSEEHW
jgi:hypothetical protein